MMNSEPNTRPGWRPRFSLLTAFLLLTIVGLSIGVARLWREVGPLRTEVQRLRNETGQLSIEDPDQISAVALQPNVLAASGTWKWRVYLPSGSDFRVCAVVAKRDTKNELPLPQERDQVFSIGPGEHILQTSFRDEQQSSYQYLLYLQEGVGGTSGLRYENECQINLSWPKRLPRYVRGFGYSGVLTDVQRQFAADEKVMLLRLFPEFSSDSNFDENESANNRQSHDAGPPTATFYLWIEKHLPTNVSSN